ncbi:hypothetical protein [Bacillus sp. FJAT-45350]|uniref:hypothetical protein n=1 Tax=Bacillus sp. FJAT-45350 TaxID=2011014 RepID=UPI000BB68657|nr:hypothetical protein [Bacillus sp. FJAT-45350]
MIHKKRFWLGISIFLISFILIFPFPHHAPLGESIFKLLGIPPYSRMVTETGLHYVGLTSILLLFISLFILNSACHKWNTRIIVGSVVTYFLLPMIIISTYQMTVASSIYALSYERNMSECTYATDESKLEKKIECLLPIINNRNKEISFEIELRERKFEDVPSYSLLNQAGPHIVTLYHREEKVIKLVAVIDISNQENYYYSGTAKGIDIILRDSNGNERRL